MNYSEMKPTIPKLQCSLPRGTCIFAKQDEQPIRRNENDHQRRAIKCVRTRLALFLALSLFERSPASEVRLDNRTIH
jgi:hypothetical protein